MFTGAFVHFFQRSDKIFAQVKLRGEGVEIEDEVNVGLIVDDHARAVIGQYLTALNGEYAISESGSGDNSISVRWRVIRRESAYILVRHVSLFLSEARVDVDREVAKLDEHNAYGLSRALPEFFATLKKVA